MTEPKPDRQIFHCDCNSFFASVEETFRPELRSVPMAVAGDPESRHGIILAKNERAKKYKISTAETVWSAKKKCPELVLVPPRRQTYSEFCERVNAIYEQYSPLVERFGVDESFIDVTGCLRSFGGDALKCANEIRERVKREIDITISIGVSWNKIFAKLGSDYKKPDAVTNINRENWKEIVFPLPASDLFFVGRKTADALGKMGVRTIGDLANFDRDLLVRRFGKFGEQLFINANGLDASPVLAAGEGEAIKSVGNGYTFKRDLLSESDVKTAVAYLSDSVATRLRKHDFKCRVVQVAIKDTNLQSITRQMTIAAPSHLASEIGAAALELIAKHWKAGKPIRTLTISGENLVPADQAESEQLSLFDEPSARNNERNEKLELTLDKIRERYGSKAVITGNILGNDLGIRDNVNK
ncbi:MAG: DNA polymerase IV [Oscillospiraceae bacterium]|jgi:DNA polymerase-4|nr:DNA polymerase IV [Oscillospiraceae bacterium]